MIIKHTHPLLPAVTAVCLRNRQRSTLSKALKTLLIPALLLTGACTRELETDNAGSAIRLTFGINLATPAQMAGGADTRTTTTETLPADTEILIQVYTSGADLSTASSLTEGIYRVSADGSIQPKTQADVISLHNGSYDFCFISPATAPSAGQIEMTAGTGLMTQKQSVTVTAGPSDNCQVNATLKRRSALLDVEISYPAGTGQTSVTLVAGRDLSVGGLAATASVSIDPAVPYTPGSTGYTAVYPATAFSTFTDSTADMAGISTYIPPGSHRGIPVPAGTYATLNVSTKLLLNGTLEKEVQTTLRNVVLAEGSYHVLKLGSGNLMPHDLSGRGTANCYIVAKPDKEYKFDARVMGNGSSTPRFQLSSATASQQAPAITPSPLTPLSAALLWSTGTTLSTVVDPASVTLKEGYVVFKTSAGFDPVTGGNAVIGVFSGAPDASGNATGTLLWSWHIWGTSYNPATENETYTGFTGASGYTLMTRNLGAYNNSPGDPGNMGLLWQWGRKDPFPGAKDYSKESESGSAFGNLTATTTANTIGGVTYTFSAVVNGPMAGTEGTDVDQSILWAIQNPTVLIGGNNVTGDWMFAAPYSRQRDNLWGNPNGTTSTPNPSTGFKSIYDPCPPGWRVPPQNTWQNFGDSKNLANNTMTFYNLWHYPATGYRQGLDPNFNITGKGGYCWSSSSFQAGDSNAAMMSFYTTNLYPLSSSRREMAHSVRCMRE